MQLAQQQELNVMIMVKAAPVVTPAQGESICVAAMSLDGHDGKSQWIRLYPVPFRDLADNSKFRKFQEVKLQAVRPRNDRRPESWKPIEGSFQPGRVIGTEANWSERRSRVAQLGEATLCELLELNRSRSIPSVPSLAVVRTSAAPELLIKRRSPNEIRQWQERIQYIESRPSLFDESDKTNAVCEVVPWRFQYRYKCQARRCNGHQQTIVDWELVALWRHVRHQSDWQEKIRAKYGDELWAHNRDTRLFVGNMVRRPQNFLVLGVFWPPRSDLQEQLI
ncbi:hypothetical protein [Candidatus Poriferisodalis sp.]|uniref:hypothetical protein n=1 Tax=Candidatus Poriferisodalis sp. TaxID=3101277 RepID=UPI003B02E15B